MTRWHLKHERFGTKPWAVQAEAMNRAEGHVRFGQFLEQGLGKTALCLNEFVDADDVDIDLVVCPQSFKMDWKLAPAEWGLSFAQTGMWPRDPLPFDAECAVYSINYEAVRFNAHKTNNGFNELMKLVKRRNVMLTIDESKAIGNPSSDTTRGVMYLAAAAKRVRLLNGTPMTESPMDYFGQLRVLGQLHGMTSRDFSSRFCVKGGFMGRQVTGVKPERERELAQILDNCSFRALKKDWRKDLPPQINVPVHLEMTGRQLQHYRTMLEEFYVELEDNDITVELVIAQQEKLRQISSCLVMKDGKEHWLEESKNNPKVRGLLDLIDGGATKVIVYYMYKSSGAMLLDLLRKHKYDPAFIRGGMAAEELIKQKGKFNNDPSCRVLVGQQTATARGHTLLGGTGRDRCNRIVAYENHFGLYWREQIKDRNHRGEQDQECSIYDLLVTPMDAIIVERLTGKKSKAEMMDALVAEIRRIR